MLEAKAVVPGTFWILRHKDYKVGNIHIQNDEVHVTINNKEIHFKTLDNAKERFPMIEFTEFPKSEALSDDECIVYGFPADSNTTETMWDAQRKLPLYTKENKSRSWHAAGHYQIMKHRAWRNTFCPKLILLDRYPYRGPFKTIMNNGSKT